MQRCRSPFLNKITTNYCIDNRILQHFSTRNVSCVPERILTSKVEEEEEHRNPAYFKLGINGTSRVMSSYTMKSLSQNILVKAQSKQIRYLCLPPPRSRKMSHITSRENDHNKKSVNSSESVENKNLRLKTTAMKGGVVVKQGVTSLIRKYGWTFVGTYFTIYLVTLGSLFASLDSGLIDPTTLSSMNPFPWVSGTGSEESVVAAAEADAQEAKSTVDILSAYLEEWEFTRPYAAVVGKNPHIANLAIAWVATKLTEPVRVALALAIVPRISKILGQKAKGEKKNIAK